MGEGSESTSGQAVQQTRRPGRPPKNPANHTAEAGRQEAGQSGSTETGSEEIEVVSGLDSRVTQQIPTTDPPKRGPGRPPGPSSKQKSKPTSGVKSADKQVTADMVQTVLSVSMTVLSMRMGDHWRLQPQEAAAIAEPVANIMERLNLTEKTGAYGDYIALGAALLMVFGPRVMTQMDISKKRGGITLVRKPEKPSQPASQPIGGSVPDADPANGGREPVQQRRPDYTPSDVKQSLAWITG